MEYMQGIFINLWAIWKHRNLVVHEGKDPNPIEVVLMVQTLSCRYKDYYTAQPTNNKHTKCSNPGPQTAAGQWQLIIKIAGAWRKKAKRCAYAYEAKNLQGDIMFCGAASSLARSMGPRKKL